MAALRAVCNAVEYCGGGEMELGRCNVRRRRRWRAGEVSSGGAVSLGGARSGRCSGCVAREARKAAARAAVRRGKVTKMVERAARRWTTAAQWRVTEVEARDSSAMPRRRDEGSAAR